MKITVPRAICATKTVIGYLIAQIYHNDRSVNPTLSDGVSSFGAGFVFRNHQYYLSTPKSCRQSNVSSWNKRIYSSYMLNNMADDIWGTQGVRLSAATVIDKKNPCLPRWSAASLGKWGSGKCARNQCMMTSSNGNIFRVTGHLCGEFIGHRWIPRTKVSDAELWCFLWSAPE